MVILNKPVKYHFQPPPPTPLLFLLFLLVSGPLSAISLYYILVVTECHHGAQISLQRFKTHRA